MDRPLLFQMAISFRLIHRKVEHRADESGGMRGARLGGIAERGGIKTGSARVVDGVDGTTWGRRLDVRLRVCAPI